ncbi:hypothetical protein Bca4012_083271 [Brassica carinata]|uniref:Uncharacterized protein n=1 Tax=Brassica carinata TaxID=52824 RepID=A0A8X7VAM0_BRACI|nr:hypothetical protein Bca52824_027502 [Brassica carinata]
MWKGDGRSGGSGGIGGSRGSGTSERTAFDCENELQLARQKRGYRIRNQKLCAEANSHGVNIGKQGHRRRGEPLRPGEWGGGGGRRAGDMVFVDGGKVFMDTCLRGLRLPWQALIFT